MNAQDFKIDDRVFHKGMHEAGTVIHVSDDAVTVRFDRPSARGNSVVGEYDEVWFNTHEGWLQHIPNISNGERP